MRTLTLAILAAVPCLAQPTLPKAPEEIGRWLVEDAWNRGDLSLAGSLLAPGLILHYRGVAHPLTEESGTTILKNWRAGFPDFHFRLEDLIVAGNKVVLRIPFTGTHLGKFWGIQPTGRKIDVTETLILRIEGGKIAEMWEDYDEYGMRIQLGLLPAP